MKGEGTRHADEEIDFKMDEWAKVLPVGIIAYKVDGMRCTPQ